MRFEIRYSSKAIEQLRQVRAFDRATILETIERVLQHSPTKVTKTAVKRLRQPAPTQFRLRTGNYRVYYDVDEAIVSIIQILSKEDSIEYLRGVT